MPYLRYSLLFVIGQVAVVHLINFDRPWIAGSVLFITYVFGIKPHMELNDPTSYLLYVPMYTSTLFSSSYLITHDHPIWAGINLVIMSLAGLSFRMEKQFSLEGPERKIKLSCLGSIAILLSSLASIAYLNVNNFASWNGWLIALMIIFGLLSLPLERQ